MIYKFFIDLIKTIHDEVTCDGGETITGHNFAPDVTVYNEDTKEWYDVVEVKPSRLLSCGCWSGIIINVSKG